MKAVLIFDSANNLLYHKWDDQFLQRMKAFGESEAQDNNITDSHNVSQLLSPIITSQRVMAAQFGNTYSSMQCKDGTSIIFEEWLDHVFMIIGEDTVDDAHRELLDCKTLAQHVCGLNIQLLLSPIYKEWLTVLLESRTKGDTIPGASGVIGESGATATALNALKSISKEIKCSHSHYHLLLYVGDKLLALYSSRGSEDLTSPDLILLSIQCIAAQEYWQNHSDNSSGTTRLPWLSEQNSAVVHMCAGAAAPCAPHSLHVAEVAPRVVLALLVDMDIREVGLAANMTSQILANLRRLLLQRSLELLPSTLDSLEAAIKKTNDALRKCKFNSNLSARLTARMLELRKSCTTTTPLTPETTATAMHTALEAVTEKLKPDIPFVRLEPPLADLRSVLAPYVEFLKVKALRCFGLASGDTEGSITLHKYVEEFPGLIHFIYVDRTTGRFIAPDVVDCADMLSKETLRHIISRCLSTCREGYTGRSWRVSSYHVCYLRWWERRSVPAQPAAPPHPAAVRALTPPVHILPTFYRQLTELSFPNDTKDVSLKELICIHLGLLPASTAIQQARRLAHSVLEIAGDNSQIATELI